MANLVNAKRIVVKVGTSTITYANGKTNVRRMARLVSVLSDLQNSGREIILVSSGAIGVGAGKLGLKERPHDIKGRQAAAAVGQTELMFMYDKFFSEYGHKVGQLLLTRGDVDDPVRRSHLVNTFMQLIDYGAIPIVNENDSVAVDEIEAVDSFGDNDSLSATVATLVNADALIILSDIDGLFESDPRKNAEARLISYVKHITDDIKELAGGTSSEHGTGGMITKLAAAEYATRAGIHTIIMNGEDPKDIYRVIDGRHFGTFFEGHRES